MTLLSVALKNIKSNMNKYVMYYLSNALVVMIFFIFSNFIYNPSVSKVGVLGNLGLFTVIIMYICEGVILIFTILFSNYSITNFLKTREKEFGLLAMFGLTKPQIRRYVMLENIVVSVIAVATGIAVGVLFSKLFFMAITVIMSLNSEIPFAISVKALIITFAGFILLFQLISYIATFRIKNNNIIELLKGERVPKPTPKFSIFKAICSILLIIAGYALAIVSGGAIIMTSIPVLVLVITGTYLLFSQFSVFLTNRLQKNKDVFYNGTNMITLSQIIYKLKDNARILFIVSILGAITLTASITVYSIEKNLQLGLEINYPQDISFMQNANDPQQILEPAKVETIFKKSGHEVKLRSEISLIKAENESIIQKDKNSKSIINTKKFYIMSAKDYNILAEYFKKKTIDLEDGKAVINSYNFSGSKGEKVFKSLSSIKLNIGGKIQSFSIQNEISGSVINVDENSSNIAVVNDRQFKEIYNITPKTNKVTYYGYNISNWKKSENAIKEIKGMVPRDKIDLFTDRVIDFGKIMGVMSLFFFIGTFISIIFFVATGSILYFKMFNEIQKDKHEFISLKKMGVSEVEIKKIISIQALIMFFLPYAVAFIHSTVAITTLGILLSSNLISYFVFIAGIYLVLQILYYIFAKNMYTKEIKSFL